MIHWTGFRDNLQESPFYLVILVVQMMVSCRFPLQPIHWKVGFLPVTWRFDRRQRIPQRIPGRSQELKPSTVRWWRNHPNHLCQRKISSWFWTRLSYQGPRGSGDLRWGAPDINPDSVAERCWRTVRTVTFLMDMVGWCSQHPWWPLLSSTCPSREAVLGQLFATIEYLWLGGFNENHP